jgi:hypothetical protein
MRSRHIALVLLTLAILSGCQPGTTGTAPSPSVPTGTGGQSASGGPPAPLTVPDVAGKRLSDAEAALSAQGFTNVRPVDATGHGRAVLAPTNWIVQAQTPAAGSRLDPGRAITLRVRKPTDGAGPSRATAGTVPNVVCQDLQTAQDTLQAAGFYNLSSADATGRGRVQIIDRNWVVVKQSVRPGGRPAPATHIVLGAVKFGEPTGDSGCRS